MGKIEKFALKSQHDGLALAGLLVAPEDPPVALVQFAHGMSEHKERYVPLMEFLAEHGCACMIHDHRGHGESIKSPDDLGFFYADGGRGAVRDLHQFTMELRNRYPKTPLVLVGHSMGTLVARAYAPRYGRDIDGLILSGSPGENSAAKAGLLLTEILTAVHRSRRARSKLMDAMVNGPFAKPFKNQGPFGWLSANQDNVKAYVDDPLCGFGFTLNGYRALLNLMIAAYDDTQAIRRNLPVHFMSGQDDSCAPNPKGFQAAIDNIRSRGVTQVTGKMYPGLRHELFNEGVQEVWDDLLKQIFEMTNKE